MQWILVHEQDEVSFAGECVARTVERHKMSESVRGRGYRRPVVDAAVGLTTPVVEFAVFSVTEVVRLGKPK